MKALARNKRTFYYALYNNLVDVHDEDGFYTGEQEIGYSDPVKAKMNISASSGAAELEWFGITENYDKIIVTDDMECPIAEDTVLWIDAKPPAAHNYVVVRVARSINSIAYGVKGVSVSGE